MAFSMSPVALPIWSAFYTIVAILHPVPFIRTAFGLFMAILHPVSLVQHTWQRVKCKFYYDAEDARLHGSMEHARNYDEWLQAAQSLDELLPGNVDWKHDPKDPLYHWEQIQRRTFDIDQALRENNFQHAYMLLQFGLVRGLGSIADARLYNRIYAGTKSLIEQYISSMLRLIDAFFERSWNGKAPSHQAKFDHAERFRIAFGRTGLVLQGGSIFGLYHIGVMKALHEQGLLPQVIVGTGTGAIMAALAGIHPESELSDFLSGRGINLDAFAGRSHTTPPSWTEVLAIFVKRLKRFYQSGYVLDRQALEQCVEDNVGDMTFREAHERSGRIVSITIEGDSPGTPNCLNYLTTPHVLIRTAAMASNESDVDLAPAMILQKNHRGEIEPWTLNDESPAFRAIRRKRQRRVLVKDEVNAPLLRVSQLENINHFIISQARPYIVPFQSPSLHRSNTSRNRRVGIWSLLALKDYVILSLGRELTHRMHQYDRIWGLPRSLRRFLLDEKMPFRSLTLVPEVKPSDFLRLLRNPTADEIDRWIALGEKSVWPCVSALHVRCDIEIALENQYKVQPRRPLHQIYAEEQAMLPNGPSRRRMRARSTSAESNPT